MYKAIPHSPLFTRRQRVLALSNRDSSTPALSVCGFFLRPRNIQWKTSRAGMEVC